MTIIGFHASHEQIPPGQLLKDVQQAEQAGFGTAMCSDHFSPWSERQGQSGYAWSWLGAALATTQLSFGVVSAPGQRYHPAVVAQKISTLGSMVPGRFWAALGSGENANEHITGDAWPPKEHRNERLLECVDVIHRMLVGEEVTHRGHVTVDRARLWDPPAVTPALVGAAVSVATAAQSAGWADGLVTLNQPHDHLRQMIETYREHGGKGPLSLQVHLSWAPTEEEADDIAYDQWRSNVFGPPAVWDIDSPEVFDIVSQHVPPIAVHDSVRISSDLEQHAAWIQEYADLGFDRIYLHHVGQEQRRFIEAFGERVLPQLTGGN